MPGDRSIQPEGESWCFLKSPKYGGADGLDNRAGLNFRFSSQIDIFNFSINNCNNLLCQDFSLKSLKKFILQGWEPYLRECRSLIPRMAGNLPEDFAALFRDFSFIFVDFL